MSGVTDVVARFDAGSVDVCKSGDLVSLHLATGRGIVVVRINLREFTLKCRGPRDHNLNRLPNPADYATDLSSAEVAPPKLPHADSATYSVVWQWLTANLEVTTADAAIRHGVSPTGFQTWIQYHHNGDLRTLRQAAGLPIKPRSIQRQFHGDRAPITKPSGGIL